MWQVVTLIEDERGGSQNIALADALDGRCWFPWRYWVQQQRLYGRIRFLMTWNKRWLSGARKLYHFGQWYGENLSDHHHYEIPQKYCALKRKGRARRTCAYLRSMIESFIDRRINKISSQPHPLAQTSNTQGWYKKRTKNDRPAS